MFCWRWKNVLQIVRTLLGVIPLLMWPAELIYCIECRGNDYFIWIFPFFFACTSLPSSLVFCHLVQVACSKESEERSFLGLLRGSAFSSLLLGFLSMCQVSWCVDGPLLGLGPWTLFRTQTLSSHKFIKINFQFSLMNSMVLSCRESYIVYY